MNLSARKVQGWLIGVCAGIAPAIVLAQSDSEVRCTMGDDVRRVMTVYESGGPVPCSVRYQKETEAPGEAAAELWSAQNEAGYCEARAREFVERLEGWGWQCAAATGQGRTEN